MKDGTVRIWHFALALALAFLFWFLHNLSFDYSSYLQYRVRLSTDIEGYESSALSNEVLILKGRGSGFYILKNRSYKRDFPEIDINLSRKHLTRVKGKDGVFSVKVSDMAEKIDEAVEGITVDFFETETLTFNLEKQSFKKVPVALASDIRCHPQYMIVGEIELRPDSVVVYGNAKDLDGVSKVTTRSVVLENIDKSVQGIVDLERLDGFRVDAEQVYYSFDVQRYVENTKVVPVTVRNAPKGKNFMVLPSSVTVTYRTPVRGAVRDFSFEVDYRTYLRSTGSKVIPKMVGGRGILSYEIEPRMVECISVSE